MEDFEMSLTPRTAW